MRALHRMRSKNGTSGETFIKFMGSAKPAKRDACERAKFCRHLDWQYLPVGDCFELASVASFYYHGVPVRRSPQLVRATLFSHAAAGEVWTLAKFLCGRVRGHWRPDARLCLAAGALLHKSLVARELAAGNSHLEYLHVVMDWLADCLARQTELPA